MRIRNRIVRSEVINAMFEICGEFQDVNECIKLLLKLARRKSFMDKIRSLLKW